MGNWKIWLCAGAAIALMACSGSSGSSGPDDSSSGGTSNSSGTSAGSSSSVTIPDGATPAALSDLPKVFQFGSYEDYSVVMAIGESGVYSKILLDSNDKMKLQIVGSFTFDDAGIMHLERLNCVIVDADLQKLCENADSLYTIQFVMEDDVLKAGLTEDKLEEVVSASLPTKLTTVNKASELVGEWNYETADSSFTLQFLSDSRFVLKSVSSMDSVTIAAGSYDVQGGYVLAPVLYWNGRVASVLMYTAIKREGKLYLSSVDGKRQDTLTAGTLPTAISLASLKGTWGAEKKTNSGTVTHVFEMEILSTSKATIYAEDFSNSQSAYRDEGEWAVYGNLVVLDWNKGANCSDANGTIGIIEGDKVHCFGQILGFAELDGDQLTFENDYIPTVWTLK